MRVLARAVLASFIYAYSVYTQYRAEFLLYMTAGTLPLIMMFVWMSLAESGTTGATTGTWFAAYFLMVFGARQLSPIWLIRELDDEVRTGRLSGYLMHPIESYWRLLGWHFADLATRLPLVLIIVPIGLWLSGGFHELSYAHLPLFLATLLAGTLLHFHLEYALGLAAFWTDQSLALEGLYWTLFYLLGGLVVPLEMFPPAVRAVLAWTPWPYFFGFPVEVIMGTRSGEDLLQGVLVQAAWLAVMAMAGRWLWKRGLRRYGAVGA